MTDLKISQLSAGGAPQTSDLIPVARGSSNVSYTAKQLAHLSGCRIYNSAAQSIANNTGTPLSFDTVRWDTDSMYSASHPTRITFNTAGVYLIGGAVFFAIGTDGAYRTTVFVLNGDPTNGEIGELLGPNSAGNATARTPMTVWKFNATDFIELYVYQGSGGSLNVVGSATKPNEGAEFFAQLLVAT